MDNFNLKKFLIENKMTRNSRLLAENYDFDNEDLKTYDGPTKIINGILHRWLGNGYFPSDQEGIDTMKTSFVQKEKEKVDRIINQRLKGKKGIGNNYKVKYFIANPNYNPNDYDDDDDNDDAKYKINVKDIVDALRKYAAQNNLEIDPDALEYYIENADAFGYDYGSGDFEDFEEMGGYDMEMTPGELYKEFISITDDI